MKVGIDARALSGSRGVGRYARTLLTALTDRFPHDEYHAVLHRGDADVLPPYVRRHRTRLPRRPTAAAGALAGRPTLDRLVGSGLDVLWLPAPAPVGLSRDVPVVLTIHDLSFEERPTDFTPYERLWHRAMRPARLLARADRVLADTAATRDAVLARHRIDPERITVVPPGVGRTEPVAVARRTPYFLWVGALEPRKAPEVLSRAYAAARAGGSTADLVVVGEGRSALDGPGVRRLGSVDDATLATLYRDALALVMPSRLEGFGFPPLEAALHGTPSIVSDLPVFRETLGTAAVLVPVEDDAALANALLTLERDPALAAALGDRARTAAERYTWERAADATHAVLEAAARDGRTP